MEIIQVNAKAFTKAINDLSLLIDKNSLPVLQCVKIVSSNETLKLTTSNVDTEISITLPIKAMQDDIDILVDVASLKTRLAQFKNEDYIIEVDHKDHIFKVSYGKKRYEIPTSSGNDFPVINSDRKSTTTFEISASKFSYNLSRVSSLAATVDVRYFLNSVCIEFSSNMMTYAATNGHVLGKLTDGEYQVDDSKYLIPSAAVSVIQKLLASDKGIAKVECVSGGVIKVTSSNLTITSKLIDAGYVSIDRVIPATYTTEVQVSRTHLKDALKVTLAKKGDEIDLSIIGDTLEVSHKDAKGCLNSYAIEIDTKPERDADLNGLYYIDNLNVLLNSIDSEVITLAYASIQPETQALIIKDSNSTYLTMPIRRL